MLGSELPDREDACWHRFWNSALVHVVLRNRVQCVANMSHGAQFNVVVEELPSEKL